ncbi:MAG: glycosyltransferase [Verrucomicrobiota bacterium]|nr:glycosyltransferase [Verrucomicrobiota bacterium]
MSKYNKVIIYWDYYQAYHCARVAAVMKSDIVSSSNISAVSLYFNGADHHLSEIDELIRRDVIFIGETNAGALNKCFHIIRFLKLLNVIKPNVIFTPGYSGVYAWISLCWAKIYNSTTCIMFETQYNDFKRQYYKEIIKKILIGMYDLGFAGGATHLEYLNKLGMRIDRIVTGYDSVNNEYYSNIKHDTVSSLESWRKRLNIEKSFFLSIGRMIPKKGFNNLLKAYKIYLSICERNCICPYDLIIIGDGPERNNIAKEIASASISNYVIMPGYLTSDITSRYLSMASVFIMPSIYAEQWGLVINEAMAAGVPVIASNICGATHDLIEDGITGFTYEPMDVNTLANIMYKLSIDEELRIRIAKAGRERVDKYSVENFAIQFSKIITMANDINS